MIYTVEEIFEMLQSYGLTKNIQVVRRWIRQGKIRAHFIEENNRKRGQQVKEEDWHAFLKDNAPGILNLLIEKKALEKKLASTVPQIISNDGEDNSISTLEDEPVFSKDEEFPTTLKVDEKRSFKILEDKDGIKYVRVSARDVKADKTLTKEQKEEILLDYFQFKNEKKKETLFLLKPFNTLSEFLEDEWKIITSINPSSREYRRRRKRGEWMYEPVRWHFKSTLQEYKLENVFDFSPEKYNLFFHTNVFPVTHGNAEQGTIAEHSYSNLRVKDGFINPKTKEVFATMEEALTSIFITVVEEYKENKIKK
ncbi:hypothetical protein [Priestia megaterium]